MKKFLLPWGILFVILAPAGLACADKLILPPWGVSPTFIITMEGTPVNEDLSGEDLSILEIAYHKTLWGRPVKVLYDFYDNRLAGVTWHLIDDDVPLALINAVDEALPAFLDKPQWVVRRYESVEIDVWRLYRFARDRRHGTTMIALRTPSTQSANMLFSVSSLDFTADFFDKQFAEKSRDPEYTRNY